MIRAILCMALAALAAGPTLAQQCVTATIPWQTAVDARPGPIASDSAGRIAVVSVQGTERWSIGLGLFTYDLERITPDVPIASGVLPGTVHVVWNGEAWGVFWRGLGGVIHLQRVSASGQLIGAPLTPFGQTSETNEAYDVEPAAGGWVVARTVSAVGSSGIRVSLIDGAGAQARSFSFPTTLAETKVIDIEPWSEGFAFVWDARDADSTLTFMGFTDPAVQEGWFRVLPLTRHEPSLEWDGENFILVLQEHGDDFTVSYYATRVTPDLEVGPERVLLVPYVGTIEMLDFESNGYEAALLYHEVGNPFAPKFLRLLRFIETDTEFEVLNDTYFASDGLRTIWEAEGGLAWTGASWVAGITLAPNQNRESFLASLCPLGVTIVGPGTAERLVPVTFEATLEGGRSPFEFEWDFGDHSFASGQRVTHTFLQEGTYRVKVSVRDGLRSFAVGEKTVEVVTAIAELTLHLEPIPQTVYTRDEVTLAAVVEGGKQPVSIEWQLGDGRTATGAVVHASWATPGRKTITVTARDASGSQKTVTATVDVLPRRIRAVRR